MERYDSTDSNFSDFEFCCPGGECALAFNHSAIENVILNISDRFDLRVVFGERMEKAMKLTSSMAMMGGIVGQHYGGSIGSAIGTAVGGACGIGLSVISMRDIWSEISYRLADLFELVYDFLVGMGVDDYRKAATMITSTRGETKQLAMVIMQVVSDTIGKKVVSSLTQGAAAIASGSGM